MLFGPSATLVSLCLSIFSFSPATCAQQVRQPSVEYTQDTAFRDSILNVTNTYRKQHNATRLVWNDTLADYAGEWSGECKFGHSGGPYGENLAAGYENASASVIAWGEEREEYNFRGGDFSPGTGHFTQLVWKTTSQVGCSRKECNAGEPDGEGDAPGWYVVCEYSPAGNVIGTFQENVQAKLPKDAETCPQGAVCGAASALRGSIGALWIALLVSCGGLVFV